MSNTRQSPQIKAQRAQALTDLTLTVFRLNGALMQWGDSLARPLGLTSARWQMLGAIALAGKPLTSPQIGVAMGVSRQGAQKRLNALDEAKLVAARPNPAHRRSPLYELTALGRQQFETLDQVWRGQAAELANAIPAPATATAILEALLLHLLQLNQATDDTESPS